MSDETENPSTATAATTADTSTTETPSADPSKSQENNANDTNDSTDKASSNDATDANDATKPVEDAAANLSSLKIASDEKAESGKAPAAAPAPGFTFSFNSDANNPTPSSNLPLPQLNLTIPDDDDDDDDDEEGQHANPANLQEYQSEFLSLLPPQLHPKLSKLKSLHADREEILEQYRIERAALENKFGKLMGPLYEERRRIVSGEADGEFEKEAEKKGENVGEGAGGDFRDVKGVPQFWACAMGHVDVVAELITEADVDCLDYLTDITCTDDPSGTGFTLNFHFTTNPYFTNSILTKKYEVPNLLTEDEPILQNVTGCTINWKAGKSLTHKEVTKKQRKKGGGRGGRGRGGRGDAGGQIRTITKTERTDSFFHFFTPPKMPNLNDVLEEEEADAVEEAFDHDYDVAQAFRGHLIPKAVLWFTGEAMEDFDEGLMEGVMEVDEDDDDEDGDDGEEGGKSSGGTNNSPFPPAVPGDGENPECKQN